MSKAAVPKERQRLIWRGRVLQDGQLLDEAGELALLAPVPCLTSALTLHNKLALTAVPCPRLQAACSCGRLVKAEHIAVAQVIHRHEGCEPIDLPVTEIQA